MGLANGARPDFNSTLDNCVWQHWIHEYNTNFFKKRVKLYYGKTFKWGCPLNFVLVEFYSTVYDSNPGQCLTTWALHWLYGKFHAVVAILMEFLFTANVNLGSKSMLNPGPRSSSTNVAPDSWSLQLRGTTSIYKEVIFLMLYLLINLFCIVSSRAWWASSACKACEHSLASMVRTRCSPHPRKPKKPRTVEERQY